MVTKSNNGEQNPDSPKKPRKRTPKKANLNAITLDELMELIMNSVKESTPNLDTPAIAETKKEIEAQRQERIREIATLEPIIAEFLQSFIVVGYTMDGEKVFIGHARNRQQHDALVEHLRLTFFNIINGQQ